ncbi:MAG TPA: hypothetical protein VFQ93_08590 [Casimicrobiaceae bacterium]|nr:hypothetical protein [Casimicrobiaceae bacterium]
MNVIAKLIERSRQRIPPRKPPFFAMLARRGVTYAELENAIGAEALPRAIERCTACDARYSCGWRDAECPNAGLFASAISKRDIRAT